MNITIIGTGYVGLVSGICFAEFGFNITCVDKEIKKIQKLQDGKIPIYEPGLEVILKRNIDANRITFTSELESAVRNADIGFIAVGTPSRRGDGHADLSFVFSVSKEIAKAINGYTLVVTKSTVPVGTGNQVKQIIEKANYKAEFDIASNPEFLREGSAVEDFMRPDRVVVGVETERAKSRINSPWRRNLGDRASSKF